MGSAPWGRRPCHKPVFTVKAAEGVIDLGEDPDAPGMIDVLGELVDNSLMRGDQTEEGVVRYQLLQSIQDYAETKLQWLMKGAAANR